MKKSIPVIATVLCFIVFAVSVRAHTGPETILPITKSARDFGYYAEQAHLWQAETVKNQLDAIAWLNQYRASRYANMLSERPEKPFDLDALVGQIPAELAQTFEFNYILFIHENQTDERYGHLLKAHELAPDRPETYQGLVNYYLLTGDQQRVQFFCEKLFAAGELSPALLAWNFNALASVEAGGILLTHGDNDSYPAWVLQAVKGLRPDVTVLNLNLLLIDDYRQRIFKELGIAQIDSADHFEYQQLYSAIARQIMWQAGRPVYVATSVPQFLRTALGDSLYLVGLAFKHSAEPFDNVAFLKNNFEKRFLTDHLKIQLVADTGSNVMAQMNLHYLPALLLLHQHYTDSGEQTKAAELEPMIRQVAREGGREQEIMAYFQKSGWENGEFQTAITAKSLEKPMVKINDRLWASSTEVTNEQYEAFLMDLLKNKEFELLEICKAPKTDWRSLLSEPFRHLTDAEVFPNGHPDGPQAPVQNISHEAARHYCEWITKVYNHSTEKRKAHQQVLFRLPTADEWERAAHASHPDEPYPWGGRYSKNDQGCYLGNYDVASELPCENCPGGSSAGASRDGGFFPVAVTSFFPNDFGLYNASGNVAEMVAEKGIAKGGSWQEGPADCTIFAQQNYTQPSPAVGFRVFMEVK